MKNLAWSLICIIFFGTHAFSQIPSLYKEVDHIICVVEDLKMVKKTWQQLGFNQLWDEVEVMIVSRLPGMDGPTMGKMAVGYLDKAKIIWIEPSKIQNPFSEYMKAWKEGVYALIYPADNMKILKREAQRLREKGIIIYDNLELRSHDGKVNFYVFNTAEQGKYLLGFMLIDDISFLFDLKWEGSNRYNMKFVQYAFTITDEAPVSAFWNNLGWPEIVVTHDSIYDKQYYGQPADYDMRTGWQRHGTIPLKWCIPLKGPNIFEDHIKAHGTGFHHLVFEVEDIDKVVNDLIKKGFVIAQSGSYGEKGKPGYSRFAYLDPQGLGGITIELIWRLKENIESSN